MRHDGRYHTNIQKRSTNDTVAGEWVQSLFKCFSVTEDNSLIEIVHLMTQEFCAFTSWHYSKLHYIYDNKTGSIQFELLSNGNHKESFEFMFATDQDVVQLLYFLNQDATQMNKYEMASYEYDHHFTQDVWDRKHAHFHSTFSDTKRGYLV